MTDVEERRQSARRRASRPTAHSSALDSLRAAREGRENRVEQYEVSIMAKLCVFPVYPKDVGLGQCSAYPFSSPWSRCFDPSSRIDDRLRRALSCINCCCISYHSHPAFYSSRRLLWPKPSNPESDFVECAWSGSHLNCGYNRKLVPPFPAVLQKLTCILFSRPVGPPALLPPGALSNAFRHFLHSHSMFRFPAKPELL